MGSTKTVGKRSPTDSAAGRRLLADAMRALRGQLKQLQERSRMIAPGEFDRDLANSMAAVGRAATGLAGELRKLEAHDKRLVDRLSDEERDLLVTSYIRDLGPERRQEIRRLLDELDQAEMLLS